MCMLVDPMFSNSSGSGWLKLGAECWHRAHSLNLDLDCFQQLFLQNNVKGQRVKMHAFEKKQICAVHILFNLEHWFSSVDPILTHCLRNSIRFKLYVVYFRAPWTEHV